MSANSTLSVVLGLPHQKPSLATSGSVTQPDATKRALQAIEPGTPTALAYDGSFEGLLTCIFVAFAAKAPVNTIALGTSLQLQLGQQIVAVESDMSAAERVQRSVLRSLGGPVWATIMLACASDNPDKGMILYNFLRATLTKSRTRPCNACSKKNTCATRCNRIPANRILDSWDNPAIEPLLALHRQVKQEMEKMRIFIRFEHVEGDLWFAQCNPSCAVVPFIMKHFARRFNTQRFAIYDEVHHMAGISEGGQWQLVSTESIAPPPHTREEQSMQDAWCRFYKALSIDERYHPELRRNFMPKRLWRNITEMQQEVAS